MWKVKCQALAPEKLGEPQTRQSEAEQTLILCVFFCEEPGFGMHAARTDNTDRYVRIYALITGDKNCLQNKQCLICTHQMPNIAINV